MCLFRCFESGVRITFSAERFSSPQSPRQASNTPLCSPAVEIVESGNVGTIECRERQGVIPHLKRERGNYQNPRGLTLSQAQIDPFFGGTGQVSIKSWGRGQEC